MKKRVPVLFLLLIFLLSKKSMAQAHIPIDSLRAIYQNETLRFSSGHLYKGENGERIPYNKMQDEFIVSHEGLKEFMLYKKTEGISRVFLITSAVGTIAGVSQYRNNKDLGLTFIAGSLILNYINLFIRKSAREKMGHAVWLRNRDLLFKK